MTSQNWRARFEAPVISAATVARSRRDRGVVLSDLHGRFQAYAWDRAGGSLRQITDSETAVLAASISHDGDWIFTSVESEPGTEVGHIHRFPFGGGPSQDLTPGFDPYPIFDLRSTEQGVIGLGATGEGPALFVIGRDHPHIHQLDSLAISLTLSDDSRIAGLTLTTPGKGFTPRARFIDVSTGEISGEHDGMMVGAMHETLAAVAVVEGDWLRPAVLERGEIRPIEIDVAGDVRPVDWSEDGSHILLLQSHRARSWLYLYNVGSGEISEMLVPSGAIHQPDPVLVDSTTALAIWSDARHPRRAIEVTRDSWHVALEVDDGEAFPGPDWEEFTYESSEGTLIQGWLLQPDGDGPWPAVLYTHGGPTSVALPSFNPICSAWFDAGFVVASINYRGSTTFGETFRESLTGRIGGPDVDDVVAARHWLVEQGIADPDQIVKNGYSYGGYLTLQALGTHPHLWTAGVAGAPIADWVEGYEDMNDVLKAYDMSIWGSNLDERLDAAVKASPRTYAAKFQVPILITQPEADSRTPSAPVRLFVEDLKTRGKEVELILLYGGHVGAGKEQTITMVEAWLEFARSTLGID